MAVRKKGIRAGGLAVAALGCATIGLAACYDQDRYLYLGHGDTVTLGAGDAVATNKATHTIDPWPPHSKKTNIDLDGKRAAIAVERYETNTSIPPRGLTSNRPNVSVVPAVVSDEK
jgi:hypothetical protein